MLALAAFAVYFLIAAAIGEIASRRRPLPPPAQNAVRFSFGGNARAYFRLWAMNILLTVMTLGIFSAWAKVRARRYFYGNTYLGDDNFKYHANPKSILAARIVALAFYGVLGTGFFLRLMELLGLEDWLRALYGFASSPPLFALLFIYGWMIVRGAAFNARNSSYCGTRFAFRKKYRLPLYLVLLWIAVPLIVIWSPIVVVADSLDQFSILPFGFRHQVESVEIYGVWRIWYPVIILFAPYFAAILLLPAAFYWFAKWRAQNYSLGKHVRFRFGGSAARFYFYFLIVPLPVLLPALWAPFFTLYGRWADGFEKEIMSFFRDQAFILAFIYALYAAAALPKLFYDNLFFTGGRFRCGFSVAGYGFKIMLPNLLLSILSCGLLIPWARVRRAKYLARHVGVEADEGVFDSLGERRDKDKTGALGDAAGDVSGFEFDIALV